MTIYLLGGFVHILTKFGDWMWTFEQKSRYDGQRLHAPMTISDEKKAEYVTWLRSQGAKCLLEEA